MLLIPFICSCVICLTAIFFQESPRELFFGKQEYQKGGDAKWPNERNPKRNQQ